MESRKPVIDEAASAQRHAGPLHFALSDRAPNGGFVVRLMVVDMVEDGNHGESAERSPLSQEIASVAASVELLRRRAAVAQELRTLVRDRHLDPDCSSQLRDMVSGNTWLLGSQRECVVADDDDFSEIARTLRDQACGGSVITVDDVEDKALLPIARQQTDQFIAYKFPTIDSAGLPIYKCVFIEVKRPSLLIGTKHWRQLEDLMELVQKRPEFSSEKMHFDLILLSRGLSPRSDALRERLDMRAGRGDYGWIFGTGRMKLYVMNWFTLLDGFELTNYFMMERLKSKREALESSYQGEPILDLLQQR